VYIKGYAEVKEEWLQWQGGRSRRRESGHRAIRHVRHGWKR